MAAWLNLTKLNHFRKTKIITWIFAAISIGGAFVFPDRPAGAFLIIAFSFLYVWLYHEEVNFRAQWIRLAIFSVLAHGIAFFWLPRVIEYYFRCGYLLAWLGALLVVFFSSLHFIFVDLLYRVLNSRILKATSFRLPIAWFAVESVYPKLFPWHLADPLFPLTYLVQIVDLLGVPFLSLLLLWWAGLSLKIVSKTESHDPLFTRTTATIVLALLTASLAAYGSYRIDRYDQLTAAAAPLRVAMVQGNLEPLHNVQNDHEETALHRYLSLSSSLWKDDNIDLIIWPESSLDSSIDISRTSTDGTELAQLPQRRQPLILGAPSSDVISNLAQELGRPLSHSSVFLIAKTGNIADVYNKESLIPFVETDFLNLGKLFRFFEHEPPSFVQPGEDQKPLILTLEDGRSLKILTLICYEDLWPWPTRDRLQKSGGDVLLTVSNDAWFLYETAFRQHRILAAWRAIETRRFFIRATNNSYTEVISPAGRTLGILPPFTSGVLRSEVSVLKQKSFYVRYGADISYLIALLILLVGIVQLVFRRTAHS